MRQRGPVPSDSRTDRLVRRYAVRIGFAETLEDVDDALYDFARELLSACPK